MSPRDPKPTRDPEPTKEGPPCKLPYKPSPLLLNDYDVRTPKHTTILLATGFYMEQTSFMHMSTKK